MTNLYNPFRYFFEVKKPRIFNMFDVKNKGTKKC